MISIGDWHLSSQSVTTEAVISHSVSVVRGSGDAAFFFEGYQMLTNQTNFPRQRGNDTVTLTDHRFGLTD